VPANFGIAVEWNVNASFAFDSVSGGFAVPEPANEICASLAKQAVNRLAPTAGRTNEQARANPEQLPASCDFRPAL
jgi:hypothetical protein